MAHIVLVHGAWHGGWCWSRIVPELQAHGHIVHAPSLTGLGERAHLLSTDVNLSTHIQDIVGLIEFNDLNNIVLVGHSYGAMVITGVAERVADRIGSIVYVDTLLPKDGESMVDAMPGAAILDHVALPPPPAAFFGVNPADQEWVESKLTAQPRGTVTEKLTVKGAYELIGRKFFIKSVAEVDGPLEGIAAELVNRPDWVVHKVVAGHDAMIDNPEHLSALLKEISGEA